MSKMTLRYSLLSLAFIVLSAAMHGQYLAEVRTAYPVEELIKEGEQAFRRGDHKQAIGLYSQVIAAEPDHINAYLQRGFCHSVVKNYAKAAADYSAVVERKPDHVSAYTSRGSAYHKLGKHNEAIADFDKAIALDPHNEEAYNNRGWARKSLGDTKGACSDWNASKRMGNDEARIILKNNQCK